MFYVLDLSFHECFRKTLVRDHEPRMIGDGGLRLGLHVHFR